MRVRFTSTALRQVRNVLDYIEIRSGQGASNLRVRIADAVRVLHDHPGAGEVTSRAGTRRFVLNPYPYALFYRVVGPDVVVTRFRHLARKPTND